MNLGFLAAIPTLEIATEEMVTEKNKQEKDSGAEFMIIISAFMILFSSLLGSFVGNCFLDIFCGGLTVIFFMLFILSVFLKDKDENEKKESVKKEGVEKEDYIFTKKDYIIVAAVILFVLLAFALSAIRGITVYSVATSVVIVYLLKCLFFPKKTLAKN